MAKRYTLNDILDMDMGDISRLNAKEMRQAVNTLNDVANKRAKRLEAAGDTTSYAYTKYAPEEGDLRFRIPAGATGPNARNALYKQLMNTMGFIKSETSTVKGWRRVKNKVITAGSKNNPDFNFDAILEDRSTAVDYFQFLRDLEERGYDSESAIETASYYFTNFDTPAKIEAGLQYISANRQGGELDFRDLQFETRSELYGFMFDLTGGERLDEETGIYQGEGDDEEYTDIWRKH